MALDTRNADTSAWLVKVPHALASVWKAACDISMSGAHVDEYGNLPNLQLGRIVTEEGNVSFLELPDNMHAEGIPRRFKLQQMPMPPGDSKMHVLSFDAPPPAPPAQVAAGQAAAGQAAPPNELIRPRIEGTVAQRLDMMPMMKDEKGEWTLDPEYLKLVRHRTERAAERTRVVGTHSYSVEDMIAERAQARRVQSDIAAKQKASAEAARADSLKRPKLERDELEGLLFRLFERTSAWTFKALIAETRQPHAHLKAVLESIAAQQKRGPNKDKYELKPEYRKHNRQAAG